MAGNTWRARRGGQNPVLGGERFILAGQSCYSELVLQNVGSIERDLGGSIWRDSGGSLLSWGGRCLGVFLGYFLPTLLGCKQSSLCPGVRAGRSVMHRHGAHAGLFSARRQQTD